MSGWQPIQTVPKDGRAVLVYLEEDRLHSRVHAAYYRPHIAFVGGQFDYYMPRATHWMPLPDPPEAGK